MSLQINTNVAAIQAINTLNQNSTKLSNTLNSLSTGLRLTSAAVDPAGMTIADSLNFQATNLGQAITNGNDTVNLISIADQALQQSITLVTNIAQQATQAANATQDSASRQALQNNINGLLSEINNIASTTSYKGINLLNGSFTNKIVQIGAYQNQTIGVGIQNTATNTIGWVANQQFTNNATTGSASLMANSVTGSKGTVAASFANIGLAGFTANNNFAAIANGDVQINGINVNIFGTSQTQQLDAGNWTKAINAVSGQTGVTATANTTVTGTAAIAAGTISAGGLYINGVNIGQVTVGVGDSGGNLVNAINQYTNQTGVVASVNANGQLVLTNTTGGNIAVQATSNTTSITGIANSTTQLSANTVSAAKLTAQSFYINGAKITLNATTTTLSAANAINQQLATAGVKGVQAIASSTGTTSTIRLVANNGSDLNITNTAGAAAGLLSAIGLTSIGGAVKGAYLANDSYHGTITLTSNNAITVGGANNNAFVGYAGLKAGTYSPNVNLSNVDVTNQNTAGLAITIANSALSALDSIRANLGSVENQINATVQNIQVAQTNITQAQSAITDTNFGNATSQFSTLQVLAQAGTYALAQANATQQLVLRLMQ